MKSTKIRFRETGARGLEVLLTFDFLRNSRELLLRSSVIILLVLQGNDCWLFDEDALAVGVKPAACTTIFGSEFPSAIDSTLQLADDPNYTYVFRGARSVVVSCSESFNFTRLSVANHLSVVGRL